MSVYEEFIIEAHYYPENHVDEETFDICVLVYIHMDGRAFLVINLNGN